MSLDIFKPKAPPLFGLDISSSSVKMLEIVDAGKGAYRVERYAIEPLPRDAVTDGNIASEPGRAGAVDDPTVADQNVVFGLRFGWFIGALQFHEVRE